MMGDEVTLAASEEPTMSLTIVSRNAISKVGLVRDGTTVWETVPTSANASAPFTTGVSYGEPLPASPTSYFWKITFDNGSAVWTSPIWFAR